EITRLTATGDTGKYRRRERGALSVLCVWLSFSSAGSALPDPRLPLFIELRPQNERHHQAITPHTGFDAVRFQILVRHLPTGALQQRPTPATQTFGDVVDVTARAGLEHRC